MAYTTVCFGECECSCGSVHFVLFWFESFLQEIRSQDGKASEMIQGELSSSREADDLKQCKGDPPVNVHVVLFTAQRSVIAFWE